MKCPSCNRNEAVIDERLGITECLSCRKKDIVPKINTEFTTDSIKDQRREYKKDVLQPFHNGILSKEYLDEYGAKGLEVTEKDIKNAKYVYKGIKGYYNISKSKGGRK